MLRIAATDASVVGAMVLFVLSGCAGTTPTVQVTSDCADRAVVDNTYSIQVKGAEWKDRVRPIGMQHLTDEQLRAMGGSAAYLEPKAKFLVVAAEIENVTRQPLVLSADRFVLIRDDEAQFEARSTFNPGGILNPEVPIDVTAIFDVPPAKYTLQIIRTNFSPVARLPVYSLVFGPSTVYACRLNV